MARRMPILRHVLGCMGSSLATSPVAAQLLDSGLKIAIVPGGVAEVFYINEEDEVSWEVYLTCSRSEGIETMLINRAQSYLNVWSSSIHE